MNKYLTKIAQMQEEDSKPWSTGKKLMLGAGGLMVAGAAYHYGPKKIREFLDASKVSREKAKLKAEFDARRSVKDAEAEALSKKLKERAAAEDLQRHHDSLMRHAESLGGTRAPNLASDYSDAAEDLLDHLHGINAKDNSLAESFTTVAHDKTPVINKVYYGESSDSSGKAAIEGITQHVLDPDGKVVKHGLELGLDRRGQVSYYTNYANGVRQGGYMYKNKHGMVKGTHDNGKMSDTVHLHHQDGISVFHLTPDKTISHADHYHQNGGFSNREIGASPDRIYP